MLNFTSQARTPYAAHKSVSSNLKCLLETRWILAIAVFLSAALLSSCASVGTDFNSDNVQKLKPGMTEEQVINLMGSQPMSRTKVSKTEYVLSWAYSKRPLPFGIGAETKSLTITFDANKKMKEIMRQSRM